MAILRNCCCFFPLRRATVTLGVMGFVSKYFNQIFCRTPQLNLYFMLTDRSLDCHYYTSFGFYIR